jgi:hypothetical protein
MEEIKVIKKLESLKGIKPNSEWVSFAKRNIMTKQFEETTTVATFASAFNTFASIFETPKALMPVLSGLIVAVFGFAIITAQSTLPGDSLYSLKQAYESVTISFMSPEAQAVARVEQADQRLSELDKISKESENQGEKLAAGIVEVKKALSVASAQLEKLPENQKAELVGNIVSKISEIEKTTNASIMDDKSEDYQTFYKILADSEIKEFEANINNLTAQQKSLLNHAKENFDVSKYSEALEILHQIQPSE